MLEHPTGGGEKDVPIPPPRQLFMASAIGAFAGAAVGAMLVIWLIGCCCENDGDTRTGQVDTVISAPLSEVENRWA